ncbi:MAG: hypothetical protein QOH46_4083 [Solirubrobacteraceae bacterium]|nr:hypothetical protein [Solirubrobacteraceae bacterium]
MTSRGALRRAVPVVAATAAVAALLAGVRSRPPARPLSDAAPPSAPPATTAVPVEPQRRISSKRPRRKGPVRTGESTSTTPFSVISVRVTLTGGELTRVETVDLSGTGARTQAINDRAEPILREEALRAGSAKIDVVTGATYTSRSYRKSLQAAIDEARGRG